MKLSENSRLHDYVTIRTRKGNECCLFRFSNWICVSALITMADLQLFLFERNQCNGLGLAVISEVPCVCRFKYHVISSSAVAMSKLCLNDVTRCLLAREIKLLCSITRINCV